MCSGLIGKGVCRIIPQSEVFHLKGLPVLNGMFGVSKDEFVNGVEVQRLIMNPVPLNKLCRNLGADVCTLPSIVGLVGVVLGPEEFLVMSSAVPSALVPGSQSEPHYLSSLVLPQWCSSTPFLLHNTCI